MAGRSPKFMLFPHMVLSDKEYRHLSLLLPELSILQIFRPVAVPDWLSQGVMGWQAITDQKSLKTIGLALKGLQEFAAVHGDNSALASLGLDQISRAFSESRFRIQTELKGQDATTVDERETALLEAAVFLEMARDLDEREIEVEAGLSRMDSLEEEFREILGLVEDEELEDTLETTDVLVRSEGAVLSHMLPKRIESWFQLLSNEVPPTLPVLVTTEAGLEELIEWLDAKDQTPGNLPEPGRVLLASVPAMDGLATEGFLSLLGDPEASDLLTSYWEALEQAILSPHDPVDYETLSQKADTLQDTLRDHTRELGLSGEGLVHLDSVAGEALSWQRVAQRLSQGPGRAALAGEIFPAEPLKILVWRS